MDKPKEGEIGFILVLKTDEDFDDALAMLRKLIEESKLRQQPATLQVKLYSL